MLPSVKLLTPKNNFGVPLVKLTLVVPCAIYSLIIALFFSCSSTSALSSRLSCACSAATISLTVRFVFAISSASFFSSPWPDIPVSTPNCSCRKPFSASSIVCSEPSICLSSVTGSPSGIFASVFKPANPKNSPVNTITITAGAAADNQFFLLGLNPRSNNEFPTTEIELKAIANPANSGRKTNPRPTNNRAATGIPITL